MKPNQMVKIPEFRTTKKSFFFKGKNSFGVEVVFHGRFESEVVIHIPEELNFGGGGIDSTNLTANMWDSVIDNESHSEKAISVKEWSERIPAITLRSKTSGYSNIEYLKLPDGRVIIVATKFDGNKLDFDCSMIGSAGWGWGSPHS